MEYKRMCKNCKAIRWCIHAFGRYYREKSHNSAGCNVPLPDDEATLKRQFAALPAPNPF